MVWCRTPLRALTIVHICVLFGLRLVHYGMHLDGKEMDTGWKSSFMTYIVIKMNKMLYYKNYSR